MTHRSFLFYVFACLYILLILILSCLCHLFLQSVRVMQKMSYFFPVLCVCLDVCVVHTIRLAQLSPLLLSHPFITLWVGALTRASLLAFLAFTYPGSLPWTKSFEGIQSLGVLCFHFPVYATLLWVLGQSTMEELWGWHSWERVSVCVLLPTMLQYVQPWWAARRKIWIHYLMHFEGTYLNKKCAFLYVQ